MLIRNIIYTIFSFSLFACGINKDADYREMEDYLKIYGLGISDTCIYIFIPANQCENCIIQDANNLSPEIKRRVCVFSGFSQKTTTNFEHFYFDASNKLMGLKFIDYSNKIVIPEKGSIKINEKITNLYLQLELLNKQKFSAIDKLKKITEQNRPGGYYRYLGKR